MRDRPLHIQILLALQQRVQARKQQHEAKCGKGLEDRDYQRHVGRIAECAAHLEDIDNMIKGGLEEAEDLGELDSERSNSTAQKRRAPSAR